MIVKKIAKILLFLFCTQTAFAFEPAPKMSLTGFEYRADEWHFTLKVNNREAATLIGNSANSYVLFDIETNIPIRKITNVSVPSWAGIDKFAIYDENDKLLNVVHLIPESLLKGRSYIVYDADEKNVLARGIFEVLGANIHLKDEAQKNKELASIKHSFYNLYAPYIFTVDISDMKQLQQRSIDFSALLTMAASATQWYDEWRNRPI